MPSARNPSSSLTFSSGFDSLASTAPVQRVRLTRSMPHVIVPLATREEQVPKTDYLQGALDLLILRTLALVQITGGAFSNAFGR